MNIIQDIDEAKIFVQNLTKIVEKLHLSKSKLNSKLKWPTNKLRNILSYSQAPLIEDAKNVRKLLGLQIDNLLTKILDDAEIDNLSDILSDVKLTRSTEPTDNNSEHSPISHIIVLLHRKYTLDDEFTKKELIASIPQKFVKYSIEWDKSRLKKYVKKVKEITNVENKSEHVFKLTQKLPVKLVEKALEEVGEDWLKDSGEDKVY